MYVDLDDVRRDGAVEVADVLGELLRGLDAEWIAPVFPERARPYWTLTHGRRIAVIVGNARYGTEVEPLLPASGDSLVIVTMAAGLPAALHDKGIPVLEQVRELGMPLPHGVSRAARVHDRRRQAYVRSWTRWAPSPGPAVPAPAGQATVPTCSGRSRRVPPRWRLPPAASWIRSGAMPAPTRSTAPGKPSWRLRDAPCAEAFGGSSEDPLGTLEVPPGHGPGRGMGQ
ncbi:hypothetical protein ACWGLF_33125 [Streptomyces puniciscabiei]